MVTYTYTLILITDKLSVINCYGNNGLHLFSLISNMFLIIMEK